MKFIRLLSISAWKFAKNMFSQRKVQKNTKYPETEGLWWENIKIEKKIQMSTNHQTQKNVLNQIKENENNLKISINTERNLRETRAIAAIKNNQILLQIRKKQLKDQSLNWTCPGWRGELGTKQQKNEQTTEWTIQ